MPELPDVEAHRRTVAEPRRSGTWLLVPFGEDGPTLLDHFRMTGSLVWSTDDVPDAATVDERRPRPDG